MFIYTRTFRATSTASVVKEAVCEKCGCAYCYEMVRRAQSATSAVYGIGARSARNSAAQGAKRKLQKRLDRSVDPVGCPDCGWYQEPMVRELHRRQHRWLLTTAWVLAALTALVALCEWLTEKRTSSGQMRDSDRTLLIGMVAFGVLVPAMLIGLRIVLQKAYNPNAGYPNRPDPIPGAPIGVRKDGGSATDATPQPQYELDVDGGASLQYERRPLTVSHDGWITIQLARLKFPHACCGCLTPEEKTRGFAVPREGSTMQVRICDSCFSRFRRRRLLTLLVPGLVTAPAIGFLAYFNPNGHDLVPALLLGLAAGGVVSALAFFFASPFLIPIRFSRFSPTLNTIRIRFRNRDYAIPFADANNVS